VLFVIFNPTGNQMQKTFILSSTFFHLGFHFLSSWVPLSFILGSTFFYPEFHFLSSWVPLSFILSSTLFHPERESKDGSI